MQFPLCDHPDILLGSAFSKYVSTEVSGGFTGVMPGFYAVGNNTVTVRDFTLQYF